jgi:hypothetical protein
VPLDEESARGALEQVDLSSCRERGAPRGPGRARVTFRADGAVTQVAVLAPRGLGARAVACITERLSEVTAPPFTEPPTDVWITFHVP